MKVILHLIGVFFATALISGSIWAADVYIGESPTTYRSPDQNQLDATVNDIEQGKLPLQRLNELTHPVESASLDSVLADFPGSSVEPSLSQGLNSQVLSDPGQIIRRPPLPRTRATTINSCDSGAAQITHSGTYILTANLIAPIPGTGSCLSIANVSNVILKCDGYSIPSPSIQNIGLFASLSIIQSRNVTIEGCNTSGVGIGVSHTDDFKLVDNQVAGGISIATSTNGQVIGNQITGSYAETGCSNMTVSENRITSTGGYPYASLESDNGQNNTFSENTIDGSWDGKSTEASSPVGTDDGVLIKYENGDQVTGNTITNCWDAGVETVGTINNLIISNNTMSNIGEAAIGEYWNGGWNYATVKNNKATQVPSFFVGLYGQDPVQGPIPQTLYFSNVTFDGNSLSDATQVGGNVSFYMNLPTSFSAAGYPTAINIQNNILMNNHFDTSIPGPFISPASGFTDGGGNVWGPTSWISQGTQELVASPQLKLYMQSLKKRLVKHTPMIDAH